MRNLIFVVLTAFILTTSSLLEAKYEKQSYEKELEVFKRQPRRKRELAEGENAGIVHNRVKRGDPLKDVKGYEGWKSRNFRYVGGTRADRQFEAKRHTAFMKAWKKIDATTKKYEANIDAKRKKLKNEFATLKKKCIPMIAYYAVDRFQREASSQSNNTKTQPATTDKATAATAATAANTTAATAANTTAATAAKTKALPTEENPAATTAAKTKALPTKVNPTAKAKGSTTVKATQANLSKKQPPTNTNTKNSAISLEKLKAIVKRISLLRRKELLFQKVRNQKSEVEFEKKEMRIEELLHEIEKLKKSCELKVRVKRARRSWGRSKFAKHQDFAKIIKMILEKHNKYLKKKQWENGQIIKRMKAYKKKCIKIDSRIRRSSPANHGAERERVMEELKGMIEERRKGNKIQFGKETKDTNKLKVLQGVINALEKQLKEQKKKCGIPTTGAVHLSGF